MILEWQHFCSLGVLVAVENFVCFPNTGKLSKMNIITILESYKSQMNLDKGEDENEEMELQEESRSVSRSDHPPDSNVEQGNAEHQEEISDPGDDMEH